MARIVLIDNYDSFTWNLVHLVASAGAAVDVYRNDAISIEDIRKLEPDAIVLSPGPCTPNEAGICCDVIRELGSEIPLFGVCLGMQAIGQVYGGTVIRAPKPIHGKLSEIQHNGRGLFHGINGPFQATRYHSLIVDKISLPNDLAIMAHADDLIMAISHKTLPVHGVQFHPESILSEHGTVIIRNFLNLAGEWKAHTRLPEPA